MPEDDAFRLVAKVTGFATYEQWWNALVEQRSDYQTLFSAVLELMTAMREAAEVSSPPLINDPGDFLARQREAAMRQSIRCASAEGFKNIAVVCGAWHAPTLTGTFRLPADADDELLRHLPRVDVAASWIPWTYSRLSQGSGYGAGIVSPGWYDHLWAAGETEKTPIETATLWLGKIASLLRDEGLDVSPAHIIDAVRLAESLAAMRGWSRPGLPEFNEAVESVMCGGDHEPMQLIQRRLIVSERMGMVPPDGPTVPLQRDLQLQQHRLDLIPDPEPAFLGLDLRRDRDLERSRLFHRLQLLEIPWARYPDKKMPAGRSLGTFSELWQLQWLPEHSLRVVQAAMWGNTVHDAAIGYVRNAIQRMGELPALTNLVDSVLRADLPELIPPLLARIEDLAATSHDVVRMLDTLPYLAELMRYGGVRHSAEHILLLDQVFNHLLTRACLGLPGLCQSIDLTAAKEMIDRLSVVQSAVRLRNELSGQERWHQTLVLLADRPGIHAMIAGRATRLLHEAAVFQAHDVGHRMDRALSAGISVGSNNPYPADWLDGFIRDSGLLLIHDHRLWSIVDEWLLRLLREEFIMVLPLLRRTFATFPEAVRRQLQDRSGPLTTVTQGFTATDKQARYDQSRAALIIDTMTELLELTGNSRLEIRNPPPGGDA
jgi:hypothetical protein